MLTRSRAAQLRRGLLWVLLAVYVGFIYSNSLRSGHAAELVQQLLSAFGWHGMESEHFLRKSAHFAEYAGLGVLLGLVLRLYAAKWFPALFVPLFAGLLVPVSDEFLQLFIPGRAGMVQDVVLDFAGVLAGFGVTLLLAWGIRRLRRTGSMHGQAEESGTDGTDSAGR